jgi:hypothetical protein
VSVPSGACAEAAAKSLWSLKSPWSNVVESTEPSERRRMTAKSVSLPCDPASAILPLG